VERYAVPSPYRWQFWKRSRWARSWEPPKSTACEPAPRLLPLEYARCPCASVPCPGGLAIQNPLGRRRHMSFPTARTKLDSGLWAVAARRKAPSLSEGTRKTLSLSRTEMVQTSTFSFLKLSPVAHQQGV